MPLIGSQAERSAWLSLLRAPGLGGVRIRELLQRFGSASAVLAAGPSDWRASGMPAAAIDAVNRPDAARIEADLDWLAAPDHHLLCCDSADYPALLARSPLAPAALFVVGDPDCLWRAQIAVVGSRNPTEGGRANAADFAATLARSGLAVTSGLAEGIDTAAHRATLDAGGVTIAVMGTGPDRIYPAGQHGLARAIVDGGGALVSELPPGTGAQREHFPRRNRIIAGLSLGVLVVEAAQRSGALITARQAAEAGREVFAIPGSIHNPLARGCHRLIREGVALVETAKEVVDAIAPLARELGTALRERLATPVTDQGRPATLAGDDPEQARLWQALGFDPIGMDELASRTGLTVAALSSMLLVMELEGRVSAANGRYARLQR